MHRTRVQTGHSGFAACLQWTSRRIYPISWKRHLISSLSMNFKTLHSSIRTVNKPWKCSSYNALVVKQRNKTEILIINQTFIIAHNRLRAQGSLLYILREYFFCIDVLIVTKSIEIFAVFCLILTRLRCTSLHCKKDKQNNQPPKRIYNFKISLWAWSIL